MNIKNIISSLIVTASVLIVGCDNNVSIDETKRAEQNIVSNTVSNTEIDPVVMIVNGIKITRSQCKAQAHLLVALSENKNGQRMSDIAKTNAYIRAIKGCPKFFLMRIGMLAEAEKSKFVAPRMPESFRTAYLRQMRRPRQSLTALANKLNPEDSKTMFDNLEIDYRIQSYFKTAFSNELSVTEKDILAAKNNIAEYVRQANATNESTRLRAEKAIGMIKAGTNILDVVKTYSENMEDDKLQLVEIDEGEFENQEIWQRLVQTPTNSVTPLFEIDDGYAFFFKTGMDSDGDYVMAYKVFFRRAALPDEMTDDEIEIEIAENKRRDAITKLTSKIISEYKIEFPAGAEHFADLFNLFR